MKEQILTHLPQTHPWKESILWFDSIDSTNAMAKRLARMDAPQGTVLVADTQTQGRGRLGRSFHSPAGMGIYMSILLRPNCKPEELMHLTCATGVALCDAVEAVADFRPKIKWPNDLVAGKRKLAGILTELSVNSNTGVVDYAIIGMGINCCQEIGNFPTDIADFAGSVSAAAEREIDRAQLAAAMICAIEKLSNTLLSQKETIMNCYREDCATLGQEVCIHGGEEVRYGSVYGMNDDGGLLVAFSDGHREVIQSGEVSIRGMYGYI